MRGKAHSDETKAQVMAALLAGQGVAQVAKEFKVPEATIRQWRQSDGFSEVRAKKGERLEQLTFDYLGALLAGLKAQVEIVSTKEYLTKQPAAEVAVLHGVLADKAFRLFEAIETAAEPE